MPRRLWVAPLRSSTGSFGIASSCGGADAFGAGWIARFPVEFVPCSSVGDVHRDLGHHPSGVRRDRSEESTRSRRWAPLLERPRATSSASSRLPGNHQASMTHWTELAEQVYSLLGRTPPSDSRLAR